MWAAQYLPITISTATCSRLPTGEHRQWQLESSECCPTVVFTYQGDGDLASIGVAEIVRRACGESITVIFVNNAIYGMTSGQMAPTTLLGQTTTTPRRTVQDNGYPIRMSELLATLDGTAYIERFRPTIPGMSFRPAEPSRKLLQPNSMEKGFALVEVLSTCSVNWGMSPQEALDWLRDNMRHHYSPGSIWARPSEGGGP